MSDIKATSPAFNGMTTALLHFCLAAAVLIFVVYLAPEIEIEHVGRSVFVSLPPDSYAFPMLAFTVSVLISLTILLWRAWLLYVGPWWRSQ